MARRVVAVTNPAYLSKKNNQLQIEKNREIVGSIPIEDISVVVVSDPGVVLTQGLISSCSEEGVAFVFCGKSYLPVSTTIPLAGHSTQTETLHAQIESSLAKRNRLWKQVVRSKISSQITLLSHHNIAQENLQRLERSVKSGDPDNIEAQAARFYWPRLFDSDFRRNRDMPGANAFLNYGYAILRSAVARAIAGAGLHPSIGIHHRNRYDAMCLASDLMEPYRVLVDDIVVKEMDGDSTQEELILDSDSKKKLISVLDSRLKHKDIEITLDSALEKMAASFREVMLKKTDKLVIPSPWFSED